MKEVPLLNNTHGLIIALDGASELWRTTIADP